MAGRVVHLDTRLLLLAGFVVLNHDLAGKQLGHAGFVILDDEFLEFHGERQVLEQNPRGLGQDGRAGRCAFGHQQVAPEGGIRAGQSVLRGHIGNQATASERRLAVEPHLRANHQVAIEQPPNAHQHDGAVRSEVTNLVGRARLRGDHPARAVGHRAGLQLDLPARAQQRLTNAVGGRLGRLRKCTLGPMWKSLEALLADVFLVGLVVGKNLGRVAGNAQAGAGHQKRQNQQKPPGAVDRKQLRAGKHVRPEGTELVHVVDEGLMLLDHRADHRRDADHREQRNCEPHRRQQFHRLAHEAGTRSDLQAFGGNGHGEGKDRKKAVPVNPEPPRSDVVFGWRFNAGGIGGIVPRNINVDLYLLHPGGASGVGGFQRNPAM